MRPTAKLAIAALSLCVAVMPLAAQAPKIAPKTDPATHVTKDQILAFFAQMPPNRILDNVIDTLKGAGGSILGIDGLTPIWKDYADSGVNDHWVKVLRT